MGDSISPELDQSEAYEAQDAIQRSISTAAITGGAGLLLSAVQSTVTRENIGAFGIFTKFGSTVALFAAMGGTYQFVRTASANLREKNDPYNDALGGFFAGTMVGLRKRTMPSVLGNGLALGVMLAGLRYSGGNMFRDSNAEEDSEYMTKEELRKRFRRPINETINEIGEGRGIYGPGYDERRKQRIKERYGIDVPEPYWKTS